MAEFFPHSGQRLIHRRRRRMQLRTVAGVVDLEVLHGQDPIDKQWGCPIRQWWGLSSHQQLSLALEDKLAFTVTLTTSYEGAAVLANKWGVAVSDSCLHALTQRLGARAEARTQERMKEHPVEREPRRAPTPLAVLMLDGWQVRQRGPGWGKKKTQENRVEWHEWKTGVYYRHEQSARSESGRGMLEEKVIIGWQGDPVEFGRRLDWQAQREGLARAKERLVLADGAPWIWNVARDRWRGAREMLDFYHASQHLWELGRALRGDEEQALAQWVEPRRHRLRHGSEQSVLKEIASLKLPRGRKRKVVKREQKYFASHAKRMNYQELHQRGWPIGSGAVESACRQRQCRYKRPGQFWTPRGMQNLSALTEARHNHYWDDLWKSS